MEYNKDNPLRVFEAFAGYGSQSLALQELKDSNPEFDFKVVGFSEIEDAPIRAFEALHPGVKNYGDISKIDWSEVPDFDLFTYSSPCQDFSQAGLQKGGTEGTGTRSSLLWECRRAILAKKPKYLMLENVAALVSAKFLPLFNKWRDELRSYGYNNFAEVLNAKNYGVPQNRERVFMISIRDDGEYPQFYFPNKVELKTKLKDILENEVDTKYYLNPNKVDKFVKDNMVMIEKYIRESDDEIEPLPEHLREWLDNYPEEDGSGKELPDREQEAGAGHFSRA